MYSLFVLLLSSLSIYAEEHGEDKTSSSAKKNSPSGLQSHPVDEPYIQIGPLTVSVIKEGEIKGYIRFSVNLLVEKKEDYKSVKNTIPRLENQYNIDLSSILSNYWIKGGEIKLDNLKNIIQIITHKVIGKNCVKTVFIDSYFFANPPDFLKSTPKEPEDKNKYKKNKKKSS